jgi:hypothetical protein
VLIDHYVTDTIA